MVNKHCYRRNTGEIVGLNRLVNFEDFSMQSHPGAAQQVSDSGLVVKTPLDEEPEGTIHSNSALTATTKSASRVSSGRSE